MIRLNSDDPMIDFCVTFHNCLGSTNAKKNPCHPCNPRAHLIILSKFIYTIVKYN